MPDLSERLRRVRQLLGTVHHGVIATVNDDGTPHNTPVFMALDSHLHAFWASNPDAQHSQNIARTGQVFIALFDSGGAGGGLYIQATAQPLAADDLEPALTTFNAKRQSVMRDQMPAAYFMPAAAQRLYQALPEKLWVNMSQKDTAGHVVADRRYAIKLEDLL